MTETFLQDKESSLNALARSLNDVVRGSRVPDRTARKYGADGCGGHVVRVVQY